MKNTFIVGADKADITPPLTIPYLGYYPHRTAFFSGVHDPLYVRSLYLSHGREEALIMGADLIGLSAAILGRQRNFIRELKAKIAEQTDIAPDRIMVACTHAHSTPETLDIRPIAKQVPEVVPWGEALMEKMAASARSAKQNVFPAALRVMSARAPGIQKNRRRDYCLDDEIIVLCFESDSGLKAFVVNFACHAVIMQVQELVSADFPGVLQQAVESGVPDTRLCLYLQGACGDIDPAVGNTRSFRDAQLTGLALAGRVIEIYGRAGLEKAAAESAVLETASATVALESRPRPSDEEMQQAQSEYARLQSQLSATSSPKPEWSGRISVLEELFARWNQPWREQAAELQMIRIGNAVLLGIPGEPFCRLGLELKQLAAPLKGAPVGYANGYLGYIAPPEAWQQGGYETACGPWSQVGAQAYGRIKTTMSEFLGRLSS